MDCGGVRYRNIVTHQSYPKQNVNDEPENIRASANGRRLMLLGGFALEAPHFLHYLLISTVKNNRTCTRNFRIFYIQNSIEMTRSFPAAAAERLRPTNNDDGG